MKQSSIEYLYERLERMMPRTSMYNIDKEDYFNQAKQMHKQEMIEFGKKCFYKGFEKCETDDANCFTAWREEVPELLKYKSEEDETRTN